MADEDGRLSARCAIIYGQLTSAEQRTLVKLSDHSWHPTSRTGEGVSVIGGVALNLVRVGLVERREGDDNGPVYRITGYGVDALRTEARRLTERLDG